MSFVRKPSYMARTGLLVPNWNDSSQGLARLKLACTDRFAPPTPQSSPHQKQTLCFIFPMKEHWQSIGIGKVRDLTCAPMYRVAL